MIIGLTGGIASGKSTVSKYLAEQGFKVYDADKIAKEISESKEAKEEILKIFGTVERAEIKKIVFEDKEKLKILNDIIHPRVLDHYKKIREISDRKEKIIFDVPLLFESGIDKLCDKIIVVISNYEIQVQRIIERDKIDRSLAEKIISSQMSNEEKIKRADIVIENNSSLDELKKEINLLKEILWKL